MQYTTIIMLYLISTTCILLTHLTRTNGNIRAIYLVAMAITLVHLMENHFGQSSQSINDDRVAKEQATFGRLQTSKMLFSIEQSVRSAGSIHAKKSSDIRSLYSQCNVDLLKCSEQNVNNESFAQVSQLYVHISCCLEVIRSWLNLLTDSHGHMICMGVRNADNTLNI